MDVERLDDGGLRRKPVIEAYDCQRAGAAALVGSAGNPLAVFATGTGKSVVIADACRTIDGPTLTLVPTRELAEQNERAMLDVWPEADVGILCAGLYRRNYHARHLIATVHSVHALLRSGRIALIGKRATIIIDEAHRVRAGNVGMFRKVIAAVAPGKVMGLTATPYRLDCGRLDHGKGRLFDRICFEFGMREGIAWRGPAGERLLLPLVAKRTDAAIDTSGVRVRAGDFVERDLQESANTASVVDRAVAEIVRCSEGRKRWLAFCCGVEHAEHVAAVLESAGVTAAAVTHLTSSDQRRDVIAAYRRGDIICLCGCGIFTTGFNVPEVDLIAFLRPTCSTSLYVQMGGRGTRWAPGKDNCLVLDFARNVERLGPIDDPWSLEPEGAARRRDGAREIKACPGCKTYIPWSSRQCPECGHVFERERPKLAHGAVASDTPVMSFDLLWCAVSRTYVAEHVNPQGQKSLKVSFRTSDGKWISLWLPFDHARASYYARRHWRELGGGVPEPRSTADALRRAGEIGAPAAIGIRRKGGYWRVEKVRCADVAA